MSYNDFGSQGNFGGSQFSGGQQFQDGGNFGGGGYMAEGDKFGSQPGFSQQSQSPATARKRDEQNLVPVTIKQLQAAEHRDSKFKIDGKDIAQITLVGVILTVEQQPTNINYMIDDGSGKINVRLYVDMDDDSMRHKEWQQGMYVRVVGNLRHMGNQLSVVGFQLLPITDFNELTYHALEVIHTHLKNTKEAPSAAPAAVNAGVSSTQMGQGNMLNNPNPDAAMPQGNEIQDQVMAIFNSSSEESGVHLDNVCRQLAHISRTDVQKAVEFLSDEGHLYSTIDDSHFKSTSAE